MSLLLVVVLLFFSSSASSVSSHQYYVSDDCSSVTHTPCNPLSVYAGNMSQYNNTIFYFIGTSHINFHFIMKSVQNITLHGLDHSPTIYCNISFDDRFTIDSSLVNFSNLTFQHCYIYFEASSNIMITGSIFNNRTALNLYNVFYSKITSSVFNDAFLTIYYNPPSVCYNELHHYSATLTNVNVTGYDYSELYLAFYHGTSYNVSVIFDNVNIIIPSGVYHAFSQSLFSLYITNSSVSNSFKGFASSFDINHGSTKCNIKGVQSQSTIVIEDSQFHNNYKGLAFIYPYQFGSYHIIITTVKSCSVRDNDDYGLLERLSTSIHISVIDSGGSRGGPGGARPPQKFF